MNAKIYVCQREEIFCSKKKTQAKSQKRKSLSNTKGETIVVTRTYGNNVGVMVGVRVGMRVG